MPVGALLLARCRRTTGGPAYLPASVYAAFAAGGAVAFPAGEFIQTAPLTTNAAVAVTCPDGRCWLVPRIPSPVNILSPERVYKPAADGSGPARSYSHLTGLVTAATTSLTIAEPLDPPLAPGEVVKVGLSLNFPIDPAEFDRVLTRTVLSVVGDVVTFTEPFGYDPPVFASLDALRAEYDPDDDFYQNKIGPWGAAQGPGSEDLSCRGHGLDHGLLRFTGDGLIAGASVTGLGFRDPDAAGIAVEDLPNGTELLNVKHVAGLSLSDIEVDGCRWGDLMRLWYVDGATVDGVTAGGTAWFTSYAGTVPNRAAVVKAWGGSDIAVTNLTVGGFNWYAVATEIQPATVTLDGAALNSAAHPDLPQEAGHFNWFGAVLGDGPTVKNVTVAAGQVLFTALGNRTQFEDVAFGLPLGDVIDTRRHSFAGTLTLGTTTYNADAPAVGFTVNLTLAAGVAQWTPTVGGLVRGRASGAGPARVRFTGPGAAGLTEVIDGFGLYLVSEFVGINHPYTPGGWFELADNRWATVGDPGAASTLPGVWAGNARLNLYSPTGGDVAVEWDVAVMPEVA